MDYHHHARLTIYSREHLARSVVEGRLSLCEASAEHGLSRQSAAKWVRRYREQGVAGLKDRSSRPHHSPRGTSGEKIMEIERLRRQRWTGVRIAHQLGLSHATIGRVLRRLKLNRIRDIEPRLPPNRYEHAAPGDMLHLDIKRLVCIQRPSHRVTGNRRDGVKGIGAEFLHVAIDDHSRIAFTAMYPDQTERSSTHFLAAAVAWFDGLGIRIRRVLTDNGPCYKANNFARICQNSADRTASLPAWTHQYNWHRPHASLNQLPPISRSGIDVNNLLTHHT
jgi:transposase InsO family protein